MNFEAHNIILQNAVAALPDDMQKVFTSYPELLNIVGNYPDIFDDPTRSENEKNKIDPQWQKYCIYPSELAGKALHFWPAGVDQQHERKPVNIFYSK